MGVRREQAGLTLTAFEHDRDRDHVRVEFEGVRWTEAPRGRHHRG